MSNIDKQALRQLATDAHELGIIKRYSKGLEAQRKFYAAATPLVIRALLDELEALQSFRTAYMECSDKTDWVQTDKRLDVIKPWGKHRADVLKLYIDHLESNLEAAEHTAAVDHEAACSLVEENEELKRKLEAAEQRIAELEERTPTVKMPEPFKLAKSSSGLTYYYADEVDKALAAASINVEAE
ncbi:hypothetical protein [Citrobacter koseri]|uniref:hypothetical protein n=1 Tax=Citrobacter koseri TaxID=545 RepID=UPI001908DB7F|nr:hypothetical protein [Citrobacter koseri]MBJ9008884.1 hypothetical protein [Citrobacter koseri]